MTTAKEVMNKKLIWELKFEAYTFNSICMLIFIINIESQSTYNPITKTNWAYVDIILTEHDAVSRIVHCMIRFELYIVSI